MLHLNNKQNKNINPIISRQYYHVTQPCPSGEKKKNKKKTQHKSDPIQSLHEPLDQPSVQFSSAKSLSRVWIFATPWIPALQASLSITNSWSLLKLLSHRVGDAIQPSHPLSSSSPPAPNPFQHQGLFQWVRSSHQVANVLEFQLQHQSFQWTPKTDLL